MKGFIERNFVVPLIDQMVATSHFVAGQLKEYCGREAQVVHPIVTESSPPFKGTRSEQISLRETQEAGVSQQSQSQYPNFPLETSSPLKGALDMVTLFTHGRLEPGKGLDTIVSVWKRLRLVNPGVGVALTPGLLIAGSGSLADWLREQGAEVIEFNPGVWETLTPGLTIGVYASTIDAFGLAPLEAQIAGLPTVILDRGGARETILTDMSGKPVGHLVHSEEAIYASLCHYLEHKLFSKPVSIVNFFHTIEHFSTARLDQDMRILMSKTR